MINLKCLIISKRSTSIQFISLKLTFRLHVYCFKSSYYFQKKPTEIKFVLNLLKSFSRKIVVGVCYFKDKINYFRTATCFWDDSEKN